MEQIFMAEMIEKAKTAKDADALRQIAKDSGVTLTAEQAEEYFACFSRSGELSDEELDNVSGGGCKVKVGDTKYTVVTSHCDCFTGQFSPVLTDRGSFRRKDNMFIRDAWSGYANHGECGGCIHLGFKSGTGYCELSG